MKRKTVVALSVFAIALTITPAFSAETATVDIVMSIQSVSVSNVGSASIAVSGLPGSTKLLPRAVFRNSGDAPTDFNLRLAVTSGTWVPRTDALAMQVNEFRLRASWGIWNATVTAANFHDNDIVTTVDQKSSSTIFWGTSSTFGDPAFDGGYNVPGNAGFSSERGLWVRFDAGAAGTTGSTKATIYVTGTATP